MPQGAFIAVAYRSDPPILAPLDWFRTLYSKECATF